jgi:hypothetical protein
LFCVSRVRADSSSCHEKAIRQNSPACPYLGAEKDHFKIGVEAARHQDVTPSFAAIEWRDSLRADFFNFLEYSEDSSVTEGSESACAVADS